MSERKLKTVTLPNGRIVTMRRPGILGIRRLMEARPEWYNEMRAKGEELSARKLTPKESSELLGMQISFVCACCTSPLFSDVSPPPPGTVSIDELEQDEFDALWKAANEVEEVAALADPTSPTPNS